MSKKVSLFDKIVSIVLDVLLVMFSIILVISIYNNIQIHVFGNKYSSFFGYSTFEVETGSMSPTIQAGDWIIVKQAQNVELNDIVTFEKEGEFITHRVIESYKDTFITKGDANSGRDEAINKEQIVGSVVKVLPRFGIIRRTIFNPVVLAALIIGLSIISFMFKKKKSDDKESFIKHILSVKSVIVKKDKKDNKKKEVVAEEKDKEDELIVTKIEEDKVDEPQIIEKIEEPDVIENVEEPILEEQVVQEMIESDPEVTPEENFDKTIYFRMVSVNADELDSTYRKTPILEEEEEEPVLIKEEKKEEKEEKEVIIQNRRKKFKNIIDKVMYFKREELMALINIINKNETLKVNESQIRKELLECYIDGKYYNFCGNVNKEYNKKNMVLKLDEALKFKGEELLKKSKGKDEDYYDKVNKYLNIFSVLNNIEKIYVTNSKIGEKREEYKAKLSKIYGLTEYDLKTMVNDLLNTQKTYQKAVNDTLNDQSSNMFELEYKKISSNVYSANLKHNIGFSKVYSDYIIDKTYSEGSVAEEKMIITLNLLFVRLLKDIFEGNFSNKYIIYVPDSIYTKINKLNKVFSMLEDEYAKNNVCVLVGYNCFIKNKKIINGFKKNGYHFAVSIGNEDKVKEKDLKNISIVDCVFVDKDCKDMDYISYMPEEVNVIYENIIDKFVGNGGK